MSCKTCSQWTTTWVTLSRAAAKKATSVARHFGAASTYPRWTERAEMCARCSVSLSIGGIVHCGRPLLRQLDRLPHEGCGCPVNAKAKDPAEHCPVTSQLGPSNPTSESEPCDCKWCSAGLAA